MKNKNARAMAGENEFEDGIVWEFDGGSKGMIATSGELVSPRLVTRALVPNKPRRPTDRHAFLVGRVSILDSACTCHQRSPCPLCRHFDDMARAREARMGTS